MQYLNEAHGAELALVRELQAQIAMTPTGGYRNGLERHLQETRLHAEGVEARLRELGGGNNPLQLGVGAFQTVAGQAWRFTKTPLDLVRGSEVRRRCSRTPRTRVPRRRWRSPPTPRWPGSRSIVGDQKTERLANSVLEDEQRMLERLFDELPRLTDAVARAEFDGRARTTWPRRVPRSVT